MKIDMENVFVGTIKICTKYNTHIVPSYKNYVGHDSIIYKNNAKLLKITNNGYVDLDSLNSFLDEVKLKKSITKDGNFYVDSLVIGVEPYGTNSLFVDELTLKKYEPLNEIKKPTVKKLKKEMLLDARIPGGIEW